MDVALRRMRPEDISQVIEIEHEAFSPGWVGTQFRRELSSRRCRFLVAYLTDEDDAPKATCRPRLATRRTLPCGAGWCGASGRFSAGPAAKAATGWPDTWASGSKVTRRTSPRSPCVSPCAAGHRGTAAHRNGARRLRAGVGGSYAGGAGVQLIAQRLYDKYGFNEVGIRKNYYADNREDAVIMTTDRIHTGAYREKFSGLQERFFERYGEVSIEI